MIVSLYESDVSAEEEKVKADARILETRTLTTGEKCVAAEADEGTEETHRIGVLYFTLKVISHKPSSRRVVCVVPKTAVKKAVKRNLIKRRIRAILEPLLRTTPDDFVVVTRKGIEGVVFGELRRDLLAAADRLKNKHP